MTTQNRRGTAGGARRAVQPALAVIGAFALAIFVHGCATTPDQSSEIRTDREYRTGSNIPVRDRASASDAKSVDPSSVQDALQRSGPRVPAGGLKGG